MKRSVLTGIAVGSVLAVGAIAGVAGTAADSGPANQAASPQGVGSMGWGMGPMGGMRGARVDGEFDYLSRMVAHHQEAIDAARQLERSGRVESRTLGASIVATQTAEIARMKAWLAAWYPGRAGAAEYRPMMRDLVGLWGDALDEAFLEDMIPHHMAAVMMSQRLLMSGRVEHQELTEFARTVRDAQHTEVFQMQRYLIDWFGDGRRPGPGGLGMPCADRGSWGPGWMMGW